MKSTGHFKYAGDSIKKGCVICGWYY